MDQLLAREIINIGWSILNVALVVFFSFRVSEIIMERGFYNNPSNRVTIAFWVYFIGEAGYRIWIGGLLLGIGADAGTIAGWWPWAFMMALISLAGGLCAIRVLTSSNLTWFLIFLMVIAGATLTGLAGANKWPW